MKASFFTRHALEPWRPRRVSQLPANRTRRRASGFTLLELLVAAAITAALAGFIALIVRNVGSTWSRASGRLSTDAEARLVLDQLALDLQGAMYRDDGNTWFAVDVLDRTSNSGLWQVSATNSKPTGTGANGSVLLTPANIADARFGQAGVWLRFFTTRRGVNDGSSGATLANTASAPVAVGYQIIRRFVASNTTNTSTAYLLHRAEARPSATGTGATARPGVLESGYNITAAAYTTSTASTNNGTTTGDPRGVQVPGSARNLDAVIADHVIDFGVRCYVRDASQPGGLRLIFPANATGALVNNANARLRATLPANVPADQWGNAQPMPEVVDVMLRLLTPEGAALIANLERTQAPPLTAPAKYNNNAQQWWWGVATENSRVYTRRITIHARP